LHKSLAEIGEMTHDEYLYWVAWWELKGEKRKSDLVEKTYT